MSATRLVLPIVLVLLLCPQPSSADSCGDFVYRPDDPGKVKVSVTKGGYEKYYRMTKAEDTAFTNNLKRIRDIVLEQPYLKPPKGVELRGWLRNWHSPFCPPDGPCRDVPINGQGILFFHFLFEGKDGKTVPIIVTDVELDFWINDIEQALGKFISSGDGNKDSRGRKLMVLPPRLGELNGAHYFRDGRTGIIVVSRGDRPWWEPVSREEYLKAMIRGIEKEIAKMGPVSSTPSTDLYRKWMSDRPQRDKNAQEVFRGLKKSNPAAAEKIMEQARKMEAQMTEQFRQESEREAAQGPRQVTLAGVDDRLQLHRKTLETLTPAERAAPAYYLNNGNPLTPQLAPPESTEGQPIVVINPDYFDKKLPRTAIQLIAVRYWGEWVVNPDWKNSCDGQHPAYLLMHEVVTKTDWGKIKAFLER